MSDPTVEGEAVLAANEAFYAAFESRDLEAMAAVWATDPEISCGHPGRTVLVGRDQVMASWRGILSGPQRLQFILSAARVVVRGDVAWVTCEENLLDGRHAGTVASINVFERDAGGAWRMVAHHGTPVASG